MQRGPGCEGCKFLKRQDNGWSNWTVDSSEVSCLKKLNPALPLSDGDVTSSEFKQALAFGETCSARVEGDGPWFDVDDGVTIEDFADDPEIYNLLKEEDS